MTPSPSRSTDPPHNDDQPHQSRVAPLRLLEQQAVQTLCKLSLAPDILIIILALQKTLESFLKED